MITLKKHLLIIICALALLVSASCSETGAGNGPVDTMDETPALSLNNGQEETSVTEHAGHVSSDVTDGGSFEIRPLYSPSYGVSFTLPDGWICETVSADSDPMTVNVRPETAGEHEVITFYCSTGLFGVCGTGLRTEDTVFNGHEASKGYYDGSPIWDYIVLKDMKGCAVINSAKSLYPRYSDDIDQILSSAEFVYYATEDSRVFRAAVTETSDGEILAEPCDGYSEAAYAKVIRVFTRDIPGQAELSAGDVIEITYNGIMTEEDPPSPCGVERITVISRAEAGRSIRYELGDTSDLFTFMPGKACAGDTVEIRTGIIYDADIHVYIDGQEISKSHYDSDYWGYSFIMPDKDVTVTARFYTEDEVWGTVAADESVLRKKYPQYFDLPTFKGLEVYVWQMAPNSYSCGVMEGTNRNKELEELMSLKGTTIEEMKVILASYDIPKENIFIMPWQNPFSSYLGDYWIIEENEDPDTVSTRRQEYVHKLREMLLGSDETGFTGSELRVRINGQTVIYERYEAGNSSLTPKTVLGTFSEETEIEGIVWDIYSTEEYPDLSYVLVISGTNSCWTYRIADGASSPSKVAYANWTDDGRIAQNCLNPEKMLVSSARHLPVFRFDRKEDIDRFRDEFKDILTLDQGYGEVPSFSEAVSEYDETFFGGHAVIMAYVTSGSGSYRFGLSDICRDGDVLRINVAQTNDPEEGTCDMAGWLVFAEVEKSVVQNCSEFDAVLAGTEKDGSVTEQNETAQIGDSRLIEAISSVLREKYRSDVPDGLFRAQSWHVLGDETAVGCPAYVSTDSITLETVYLIVYHSIFRMSGSPEETEYGIEPTVLTFSVSEDGTYFPESCRTPGTGEDYKKDIYEMFPGSMAESALDCGRYSDQLKDENMKKASEYLNGLLNGNAE